jgi:methionyl-tRNA formyltransferase
VRIVLIADRDTVFHALHATCARAGHTVAAYVHARSSKPGGALAVNAEKRITRILRSIPPGTDLLLPGSATGLADSLPGYRPDLIVAFGLMWRLPVSVLHVPRLGAVNVHASLLPRYRGPIPVHWAVRNGDPECGVTVHRMAETFDTGNIMAQRGGIALADDPSFTAITAEIVSVAQELLVTTLSRLAAGEQGEPQDERSGSYGGWMEPEFSMVDWSKTAREIHNQVRTFRYGMDTGRGPLAEVNGAWIRVLRTSVTQASGTRMECADGPIWVTASIPAQSPNH